MSNIKTRHYFGVAPLWLADAIERRELSGDYFTDYAKLATITSVQDVFFYHSFLLHAKHYAGDIFNDMCSISEKPDNEAWISEHQSIAGAAAQQFSVAFNSVRDSLSGSDVPLTVRKTAYRPLAVGQDCLMLVSTRADSLNDSDFYVAVIKELEKQIRFEQYSTTNVFKAYTMQPAQIRAVAV